MPGHDRGTPTHGTAAGRPRSRQPTLWPSPSVHVVASLSVGLAAAVEALSVQSHDKNVCRSSVRRPAACFVLIT